MLGLTDIVLRLGAAMLIGGALGLNRELHNKPTGVRTLGLVGMGSALAVLAVADDPQAEITRVIQGVIVGIGFLGAGVILHRNGNSEVHGLTTAATIWITASFGILCGLAAWRTAAVAIILTGILLTLGGPFERWCHRHFGSDSSTPGPDAG